MIARRMAALFGMLLVAACGTGDEASAPAPGVHDHTPHHGGVVGMSGQIHLEALATPAGTVRLWLTDFWRFPLSPARASGSVTLELPDGDVELPLRATGEALDATGAPLAISEVTAHFALTMDGGPVEMDFLLPVGSSAPGAAGVPVRGCVAVPASTTAGGRAPRCTLDFGRAVTALAATPDGRTLLVAATDLGVSAWRLPGGELALGFAAPPPVTVSGREGVRAHPEAASVIVVRPGGREAIVALEGRLLRYAVDSGTLIAELHGPRGVVRSAAWSPDGTQLLVGLFYDAAAHVLRVEDGSEVRRLPVEREAAAVAFSPDGGLAIVGSELGAIALFSLASEGPPRVLAGTGRAVRDLAFAGDHLMSAADDGVVGLWDVRTGKLVATIAAAGAYPRLTVSAPAARVIASGGASGVVLVHDATTGAVVERLAWHRRQVSAVAWAGPVLATADADGHVALWDVAR